MKGKGKCDLNYRVVSFKLLLFVCNISKYNVIKILSKVSLCAANTGDSYSTWEARIEVLVAEYDEEMHILVYSVFSEQYSSLPLF